MTNKEAINILINTIQPPIIRSDGKSMLRLLTLEAIQKAVVALEAADMVRCKDCRFYEKEDFFCHYWENLYEYSKDRPMMTPFDFCSRGIRKDEARND